MAAIEPNVPFASASSAVRSTASQAADTRPFGPRVPLAEATQRFH